MLTTKQLTGRDPSGLIDLPSSFFSPEGTVNKSHLAHPKAITALLELQNLADKANQSFQVVSSYRSFEQQMNIWNRKFLGELSVLDIHEQPIDICNLSSIELIQAIMLFSALPGASRHHWGTDFDIFPKAALIEGYHPQLLKSEFSAGGIAHEFNQWLTAVLPSTGFFRPYEKYQQGIASEPWHISYLPIAKVALTELTTAKLLDTYKNNPTLLAELAGHKTICENIDILHKQFICNICIDLRGQTDD